MTIRSLSVECFRNLAAQTLSLGPGVTVIYGDNAQGKTNMLEAVGMCATGRSPRAARDEELIGFGENRAHIRVSYAREGEDAGINTIDAVLQRENGRVKKYLSIDRAPVRKWADFLGRLLTVGFAPDDLRLVKESPAQRRAFIDAGVSQLHPVYFNALMAYNRACKHRNALLKRLAKERGDDGELAPWDAQLAAYGGKCMRVRAAYIGRLSQLAQGIHARMTGGAEKLCLTYKPNVVSSEDYAEILLVNRPRDVLAGQTTRGIHRDDCLFEINDTPARAYGSQGQQRTAALSVKLAEAEMVRETTGHTPVLLLDDVLSELDKTRQQFLLEQINGLQVLLTCTGLEDEIKRLKSRVCVMKMEKGVIT